MAVLTAPAKLTVSLQVTAVRPDGYHLLDAEMVSIDLCDTLELTEGDHFDVVDAVVNGTGIEGLDLGDGNLVRRALTAVGRRAAVRLTKRIPLGAGLGGGSTDAGAVLRWAGYRQPSAAVALGADVPFCVAGGRARVQGIGEELVPLEFEPRRYLLLMPPLSVDTGAAYAAWDAGHRLQHSGSEGTNDLEPAALAVEPRLERWRDALGDLTGQAPRLAGSGATWFVEGADLMDCPVLDVDGERGALLEVGTLPAQ